MSYDEIEIEDMNWNESLQAYTYSCPCGDLFQITIEELRSGEEIARCPSCSLYIIVIYDSEDFEEGKEPPHILQARVPMEESVTAAARTGAAATSVAADAGRSTTASTNSTSTEDAVDAQLGNLRISAGHASTEQTASERVAPQPAPATAH